MSNSNWEAPTPGTAADTAKPHWSKRKAGPLPVWGWIASGMVLVGIIGAFTDQSDNDETSIPIAVETEEDRERREEAEEWFGELQEDWEALEDFFEDVEENGTEMVVDDLEALEDFYDNMSDKTTETGDRLLNAIESLRDSDVAAADDDADESVTEERDAAPATTAPPVETTTAPPVETTTAPPVETTTAPAATPAESVSQREARESAASYLRYSSFSRLGLIDQLEFEGFTTEDATYGVDAQNADWFAQAVLTAESYLEYSSFSRSELIGQLEFEGFTSEQAVHGANAVGL